MQVRYAQVALFVFLFPLWIFAGTPINNDSGKTTQELQDSTEAKPTHKHVKAAPSGNTDQKISNYDFRKDGLFQGLFHVGINAAQIDGDAYSGYNKTGFDAGVGAQARFDKHLSASLELNYTMWGAQANFFEKSGNLYKANLNYVQVPISFNVLDKEIVMFSAGVNLGYLVAYKERSETGTYISDTIQQQPKKFDLDGFLAFHVIIKKQFAIGLKFSYSLLRVRGIEPQYTGVTRIKNEFNNVLTLRFMYILKATTFKKKNK